MQNCFIDLFPVFWSLYLYNLSYSICLLCIVLLAVEATNLFLRENGQEVIKAMSPQLTKKLANLFKSIANKLLTHVPVETFYVPAKQ